MQNTPNVSIKICSGWGVSARVRAPANISTGMNAIKFLAEPSSKSGLPQHGHVVSLKKVFHESFGENSLAFPQ
jgi:hypothetical protein